MPIYKQQSSILSEQELQLLASLSAKPQHIDFTVYSFHLPVKLDDCFVYLSDSIEELLLMLSASPRGSALVLPDTVESPSQLKKLCRLLKIRKDIQTFWVGKRSPLAVELPLVEYCVNQISLQKSVKRWQQRTDAVFKQWLQQYPVAFICENEQPSELQRLGVQQAAYFDASCTASDLVSKELLIIDLRVEGLHFVDLLINLANLEAFPVLILFGELPANLCRAAYNLAQNKGFAILACLSAAPDENKWQSLLHSLFSKIYVNNAIHKKHLKKIACGIYNIDKQNLEGYFCAYGMSKKQVAQLSEQGKVCKIINSQSLLDWFPDGIRSEIRCQLTEELNCQFKRIGIWIEKPDKVQTTSLLYAALLMAGLSGLRIYWLIDNETQLSDDVLKNYPISDIILSQKISHQLLGEPTDELLDFIRRAKQQKIRLGATLQQNQGGNDAMSLYGIEFIRCL